ncbi:hypothetical protein EVAR_40166_1 [Eumeta japonica]|uniref:Uncharacterized protein n=1 Tax=Eumeta variegata TaxID=151549 RepID=A0A4C1YE04_EUMVA|nr:hypothetical protein EVAR_40166_1 [Eumeta japonica]
MLERVQVQGMVQGGYRNREQDRGRDRERETRQLPADRKKHGLAIRAKRLCVSDAHSNEKSLNKYRRSMVFHIWY